MHFVSNSSEFLSEIPDVVGVAAQVIGRIERTRENELQLWQSCSSVLGGRELLSTSFVSSRVSHTRNTCPNSQYAARNIDRTHY